MAGCLNEEKNILAHFADIIDLFLDCNFPVCVYGNVMKNKSSSIRKFPHLKRRGEKK